MSSFRNRLGLTVGLSEWGERHLASDEDNDLADVILAMPEMQAIKRALYCYITHRIWAAPPTMSAGDLKADIGLPEHVVKWVMS